MSTQTVQRAGVVALPRVNLLPPEIAEAARFRRLQLAMGGAVVLSALIVGGLYVHAHSGVSSAQSDLNAAQSQQSSLQNRLAALQSVQDTYNAVQAKQALLTQAMGPEIRWSYALNDLALRIPNDVWLTAVTASETTGTTPGATTTTTPTTAGSIGTVTFSGVALKHDDVAGWLDALAKEKGFTNPTFSNSTEASIGSRKVVNWATSVDLSSTALSNRYTTKAGS